jgi:hypothetical protein
VRTTLKFAYGLLVDLFPERFRTEYGTAMKDVFHELAADREVSTADLLRRGGGDIRYAFVGIFVGAVLGCVAVLVWYVNRSDVVPFDPTAGMVLIALLFVIAGFVGAWRSGTVLGGIVAGFAGGVISSITVPGDYLLFGIFPFYDATSFVLTMIIAAAVVMFLATTGALLPAIDRHRRRVGRSFGGFVAGWRAGR